MRSKRARCSSVSTLRTSARRRSKISLIWGIRGFITRADSSRALAAAA
jgi:hypothetical protein